MSGEPVVLFNSIITETNVIAQDAVLPFSVEGIISTLTYEYWRFDVDNTQLDIAIAGGAVVDSLGILFEGLAGAEITLFKSDDDVLYEEVHKQRFVEDGANLIRFDAVTANFFRITFEKTVPSIAIVRNLMLGQGIVFERCLMGTHAPAPYQRVTEFLSNLSGTGQFLGRSIIRQGVRTAFDFKLITSTWARNEFQRFVENAIKNAYYMLWQPEKYPEEAIYGWTDEDIGVSYTGDANLMAANWKTRGFSVKRDTIDVRQARIIEEGTEYRLTEDGEFRLIEGA